MSRIFFVLRNLVVAAVFVLPVMVQGQSCGTVTPTITNVSCGPGSSTGNSNGSISLSIAPSTAGNGNGGPSLCYNATLPSAPSCPTSTSSNSIIPYPNYSFSPSFSSIYIPAGNTYSTNITSAYTGALTFYICGTFTGSYNYNSTPTSTQTIYVTGSIGTSGSTGNSNINIPSNVVINNYGSIYASNITISGTGILNNYGTIITTGIPTGTGGTINNYGSLTSSGDVNNNGFFNNYGTLTINSNANLNNNTGAVFNNSGTITIPGTGSINDNSSTGAAFLNACTMTVGGNFNINSGDVLTQNGSLTVGGQLVLNSSTSTMNISPGSKTSAGGLTDNGIINGQSTSYCSSINITGTSSSTASTNASFTGLVDINFVSGGIPTNLKNSSNLTVTSNGSVNSCSACTVSWSNGQSGMTLSNLKPGVYTATVTCGSCTNTYNYTVGGPADITVSLTNTPTSCASGTTWGISSAVTGGTAPYTYTWTNNSATTSSLSNIASGGIYTVTVTDSKSCNITSTKDTVKVYTLPAVSLTTTPISCSVTTGSISAAPTGGTAPYTYLWSNGATTQSISGLSGSNTLSYTVTVKDKNSCTVTSTKDTIKTYTGLAVSLTTTPISCTATTGSISAVPTGGTAPYTYLWSNGATTQSISGLSGNNTLGYTVAVTDKNSCTVTSTKDTIKTYTSLAVSLTTTPISCTVTTGSISAVSTGGTAPYTYLWSNGATTQSISGLSGNNALGYTVTVTDKNSCTVTSTKDTIKTYTTLSVTLSTTGPISCTSSTGSITSSVTGGTAPYTYLWSNGSTIANLSNVAANIYTVTVTDSKSCTKAATDTLKAASNTLAVSLSTTTSISCTSSTGSITSTVTGGTAPYTYLWSNGATTANLSNVAANIYTVTVTDSKSCTKAATDTLKVASNTIAVSLSTTTPISCTSSTGSITSSVTGGTAPYTYLWSNGATTANLSNVAANVYTVTVTDSKSCMKAATDTLKAAVNTIALSLSASAPTSCTSSTGSITSTVTGGTAPYTYLWSNGATTANLTNVAANTYTLTVTDSKSCTKTATDTLKATGNTIAVSLSASAPTSCTSSTGSITSTVTGGTAPYTYLWSNGATTANLSGIVANSYSVTVTDSKSCTKTATDTLKAAGNTIAVTLSISSAITCTSSTGSITSTVTGGTAPYTYLWSNGATTANLSNVAASIYTVIVTDNNSCTKTATDTLKAASNTLAVTLTTGEPTSCTSNTGTISAAVTGGTAPYTYLWSNGAVTQSIGSLVSGTYSVTVTDSKSCTKSASDTLKAAGNTLAVTLSTSEPASCTSNTGTITAAVTGGSAPYSYLWSNGAITQSITNLGSGTYSVTVTDKNSCTKTVSDTLKAAGNTIAVSLTASEPTGCTGNTGTIHATVTGGTAPYTYAWSTGAETPTIGSLPDGIYSLTVTDKNSCTKTISDTLKSAGNTLVVTLSTTEPTGCNTPTGTISATVSGGTAPYSYAWSTGAVTQSISNLASGTYSLTVTDKNSCTKTLSDTLKSAGNTLAVTLSPVEPTNCSSTGSITSSVTGGTAPYTYLWSNGTNTANLSNVAGGTYTVTVTDKNSCTKTASDSLKAAGNTLNVILSSSLSSCTGGTVTISAAVSGGTAPYTYMWSNNATTASITGLTQTGVYSVTVTDKNACSKTASDTIKTSGGTLSVSLQAQNVSCASSYDGSLLTTVSGGTAPYTYLWSNGELDNNLYGAGPGTYSVTITDSRNCKATASGSITSPAAITINLQTIQVSCSGISDGSITASVSGGTAPYSYGWTNGGTGSTISGLPIGVYLLIVKDAKGCVMQSAPVALPMPEGLRVSLQATQASCSNPSSGGIQSSVTGGTLPYTYQWSNGASTANLSNLTTGTFGLTVTDSKGCSGSAADSARLSAAPALTIDGSSTAASCKGNTDGTATALVSGGTAPYTYVWSGLSQATATVKGLAAGTYPVTVRDSRQCTQSASVIVADGTNPCQPGAITVSVSGNPTSCATAKNGSVTATVNGGTAPFTYSWTGPVSLPGNVASIGNLGAGSYAVTVTDSKGLTANGSATVITTTTACDSITNIVSCNLTAQIQVQSNTCPGINNAGSITITPSGGMAPYTYTWNHTGLSGAQVSGLTAGSYSVVIRDASAAPNTCSYTATGIVNSAPLIQIISSAYTICPGDTQQLTSSYPQSNSWSTGSTGRSVGATQAGTYTLTVTVPGCSPYSTSVSLSNSIFCGNGSSGTTNPACNPPVSTPFVITNTCQQQALANAVAVAQSSYTDYVEALKEDFRTRYLAYCLSHVTETFNMNYWDKEHHYTLYYYDQAGNLERTVPPAGVQLITDTSVIGQADRDRVAGTRSVYTTHTLTTTYQYNSLNQLVSQNIPDHQTMVIQGTGSSSGGLPAGLTVTGTQFTNGTNGFLTATDASGNGYIFTTTNGTNWTPLSQIGTKTLHDVQINGNNVYAVGDDGTFVISADGGVTWFVKETAIVDDLHWVHIVSTNGSNVITNGLVYNSNGTVYQTTDGIHWNPVNAPTQGGSALLSSFTGSGSTLTDLYWNGTTGFATLNNSSTGVGLIVSSSDGINWTAASNYTAPQVSSIQYGATSSYAGGSDGVLLESSNGSSWQQLASGFTGRIDALNVVPGQQSVILSGGQLYTAASGGTVWSPASGISGTVLSMQLNAGGTGNALVSVSGVQGIYQTSDYGQHWSLLSLNLASYSISASYVSAPDASGGCYIGCSTGIVYYAANSSTAPVSLSGNGLSGQTITKLIPTTGTLYVLCAGKLYSAPISTGVPVSFSAVTLSGSTAISDISIDPLGSGKAFATGTNGVIYSLTVSGTSTSPAVSGNISPVGLNGITSTGSVSYAAGTDGRIYSSSNGSSWTLQSTGSRIALNDIAANASSAVAINSLGSNLYTTNSGSQWSSVSSGVPSGLTTIRATASGTYSAAATTGSILYTYSPGGSWAAVGNAGITSSINKLAFNSSGTGIGVGAAGIIVRSTGNGTSWTTVSNTESKALTASTMLSDNATGYAVGAGGVVVKTTNGGSSWNELNSGTTSDLDAVSFLNNSIGVIAGANGTIKRTINGGADNFNNAVSISGTNAATVTFTGIQMVSSTLAVAVGYNTSGNGVVYQSTDGAGAIWTEITSNLSGNPATLNGLYFTDNTEGFVVGNSGTVYKATLVEGSKPPALSWQFITDKDFGTTNFHAVHFVDYQTGYIVGDNGTLLKSVSGGQSNSWEPENSGTTGNLTAITQNDRSDFVFSGTGSTVGSFHDESDLYTSKFYYDELGRLVASQNSKQFNYPTQGYSYTLYDALGRITEVGEVLNSTPVTTALRTGSNSQIVTAPFLTWLGKGQREEITKTYYDNVQFTVPGLSQQNLRNRVASVTYQASGTATTYDHATHYSYDVHGNVNSLVQDVPQLANLPVSQQYKRLDYNYDLISGNVNSVTYQSGQPDQFIHSYEYDEDNRLTNVHTSEDSIIWDQDAKYFYYEHGPIARTEIGDQKVQGMDYAYTIQGWIKGVNSNTLQSNTDIGKDGQSGTLNAMIGRDAFGYSLNYFAGDYQAISNPGALNNFIASTAAKSSILATDGPSLYNGNISSMVTAINSPGSTSTTAALTQLTAYQYDQLNRITQLKAYKDINMATNSWGGGTTDGSYQENYSYDANGNIMQLKRNGTLAMGLNMDSLTYHYETIANGYQKNTNKLRWIHDEVAQSPYKTDIEDQVQNNYVYDPIGNLATNIQEGILQINWNVYGKITDVIRADTSSQPDLSFLYDAQGSRIAKIVKPHATRTDATTWTTTWYTRDATGNVISTYLQTGANAQSNKTNAILFVQDEQMLYGSGRIGLKSVNSNMLTTPAISSLFSRIIGMKQYEGTNHLGNVLSVFSDLPMGVNSGNTIGLNIANVIQASDYYAFGMTMPGRTFSGGGYRYGFGGQELDPETANGTYTAEFWEYDSRIGRRWNRDQLVKKYPWQSPYAAFNNNPIYFNDPTGLVGEPPEEQEQKTAAGGGVLNLPKGTTTVNATGKEVVSETVKAQVKEGEVLSFKIGENEYQAHFGKTSGIFAGYFDSKGNVYRVKEGAPDNANSDTDNWGSNVLWAGDITISYFLGAAAEKRVFSDDDVAKAFSNAYGVNKARDFFYDQVNQGRDVINNPVTGFAAPFGILGPMRAGIDPIEQMVGTYRIASIRVVNNQLVFEITNRTSTNSLLYDVGPSWNRSTFDPMGNVYQDYIFTENIDYNRIYNNRYLGQ